MALSVTLAFLHLHSGTDQVLMLLQSTIFSMDVMKNVSPDHLCRLTCAYSGDVKHAYPIEHFNLSVIVSNDNENISDF